MSHTEKLLWTEKYRPKELKDLIVPERIYKKLDKGVYQNLLFYGGPGSGKTSSAKILSNGHPTLYINCSSETGVDVVRTKVSEFCSTLSLLEQFHMSARFIATCNYFNKIPDNIQSRFECINFDFTDEEETEILKMYLRRIYEICQKEGIEIEKDALLELVKRKFPDLRNTINVLQGYYAEGKTKITKTDVTTFHGVFKDLFDMIFSEISSSHKNYQYIVGTYGHRVDDVIKALGSDFVEYIQTEHPVKIKNLGEICYEVNKHSYESRFAIDPVVTLLSLVYKLQKIVN